MAKKTIITVAATGAWPKKENNPNVPMTPQEIVHDVYDCWQAGAAVARLHMRDDEGNGTMSADKFRETVTLLRQQHPDCGIVLNLTTSGDLNATEETRQAHLKELRPEMGSYDCGSMNWLNSSLFLNPPKFLEELGRSKAYERHKKYIDLRGRHDGQKYRLCHGVKSCFSDRIIRYLSCGRGGRHPHEYKAAGGKRGAGGSRTGGAAFPHFFYG